MKRHRTYAPPPGALAPLRNTRLYGGREEQIEGMALRSRGITGRPMADPDRPRDVSGSTAPRGPRTERSDSPRAFARRVDRARARMEEAQLAVRHARETGVDPTAAAGAARAARKTYLDMIGGMPERRSLDLAQASDANKIKAAA
jgi:hypothetical protein